AVVTGRVGHGERAGDRLVRLVRGGDVVLAQVRAGVGIVESVDVPLGDAVLIRGDDLGEGFDVAARGCDGELRLFAGLEALGSERDALVLVDEVGRADLLRVDVERVLDVRVVLVVGRGGGGLRGLRGLGRVRGGRLTRLGRFLRGVGRLGRLLRGLLGLAGVGLDDLEGRGDGCLLAVGVDVGDIDGSGAQVGLELSDDAPRGRTVFCDPRGLFGQVVD